MSLRPANDGLLWTRDDLILAFELYCRIPFQRTKASDPRVKELAAVLHRTPASVARKLGNFGAFDPQLAARNISGLTHGSKLDKVVWDEFHADWSRLVERAHELRRDRDHNAQEPEVLAPPTGPSERLVTAKQRLHQAFFRDAVLSSYNNRCCITGLPIAECLVAGHIVPWSIDHQRRADPTNGLCLSATFDRLFDGGLISVEADMSVCVSSQIRNLKDPVTVDLVGSYHGKKIITPSRFHPDLNCLRWHRENRFRAA